MEIKKEELLIITRKIFINEYISLTIKDKYNKFIKWEKDLFIDKINIVKMFIYLWNNITYFIEKHNSTNNLDSFITYKIKKFILKINKQ